MKAVQIVCGSKCRLFNYKKRIIFYENNHSLTHSVGFAAGYNPAKPEQREGEKRRSYENFTKERNRNDGLPLNPGAVHYFCWTGYALYFAADPNSQCHCVSDPRYSLSGSSV